MKKEMNTIRVNAGCSVFFSRLLMTYPAGTYQPAYTSVKAGKENTSPPLNADS